MAVTRWEPKADDIAQIDLITMAGADDTWVAGDTITITINTKTLLITVGSLVTDAQVATTVKQAWESETLTDTTASVVPVGGGQGIAEYAEITATVSAKVVTLTHDVKGVPFIMSVTQVTTGDETATESTPTAATGQNFWDNTLNWSAGIPITADDVFVDNSDVDILYGLGQSAVTVASLTVAASYTGSLGLPKTNEAGYSEYRTDYLELSATVLTIGNGEGGGSGRIKINLGSNDSTVSVQSTGTAIEDGVESFLLRGSGTANVVDVYRGSVGIASFGGETGSIETLRVTSGKVKLGPGATLTTVTSQTGDITFEANTTTVTCAGGRVTILGTATVGTLNIDGGTIIYVSSGTITTANVGGKGNRAVLDVSRDMRARIITNTNLRQNGIILDPVKTITHTNGIAIGAEVQSISAD